MIKAMKIQDTRALSMNYVSPMYQELMIIMMNIVMLVRTDDMSCHDYKHDITRNEISIIRPLYNASTNLKDNSKSELLSSNIATL